MKMGVQIHSRNTEKGSQFASLPNWRMRRDLNPRYESPRIHDFESRAFSLSATHPVSYFTIIIFKVSPFIGCARSPAAPLSRLISLRKLRCADLRFAAIPASLPLIRYLFLRYCQKQILFLIKVKWQNLQQLF